MGCILVGVEGIQEGEIDSKLIVSLFFFFLFKKVIQNKDSFFFLQEEIDVNLSNFIIIIMF